VLAFVGIEALLLNMPGVEGLVRTMIGGQFSWLVVLGLFMFVSYIANTWALSATSLTTQYAGLALYVVAQAVVFLPLLYIAKAQRTEAIGEAGLVTLVIFGGLTAVVFLTKKDFSFLRGILAVAGFAGLGLILCSMIFGASMFGSVIIVAFIALACGYILYDTSNVLHHYRIGQHVAASLALFSSVALLFWYILQLFMSRD
jgi:FtsH-binding integral membrane protein